MQAKVGDRVKVLVDTYGNQYTDTQYYFGPRKGDIIDVVEKCRSNGYWIDSTSVDIKAVNDVMFKSKNEFELILTAEDDTQKKFSVKNAEPKFKVGDKVISTKNTPNLQEGFIGVITDIEDDSYQFPIRVVSSDDVSELFIESELELLERREQGTILQTEINVGIERPILEERKIGKIQMNLFDEGFPHAILEVAKVMTWAAENKGYKAHDWKSLPNADTEFSAAASRHKLKALMQKVEGVPALERTDEESNIVHLAHTAFNVLAELELVLTGEIK